VIGIVSQILATLVVHLQPASLNGVSPRFKRWPSGGQAGPAAVLLFVWVLLGRRPARHAHFKLSEKLTNSLPELQGRE